MDDIGLQDEFTQILAVVMEERKIKGAVKQCLKTGNRMRFVIAFTIFLLQQWCGQNVGLIPSSHLSTSPLTYPISPFHITRLRCSKPSVLRRQIVHCLQAGRLSNVRALLLGSGLRIPFSRIQDLRFSQRYIQIISPWL
jgi:hypothetical protein